MPRQKSDNRELALNRRARELLILEMEKRQVNRQDLASRLDCTYEYVYQVLSGFRAMNITTLERYAKAIGFNVVLLGEEE